MISVSASEAKLLYSSLISESRVLMDRTSNILNNHSPNMVNALTNAQLAVSYLNRAIELGDQIRVMTKGGQVLT